MSKKHDGWILKNKWGSLLLWTVGTTRKEVIGKIGYWESWKRWEKQGHKIIKFKLIEFVG